MQGQAQLRRGTHGRERLEELAHALERDMDMHAQDAHEIASFVLGAFDGREELHDDELNPDLRSVFYELEKNRFLSFRREEYRNEEGHIRRAFYWHVRWDEVSPETTQQASEAEQGGSVYDDLPRNAWSRVAGASS